MPYFSIIIPVYNVAPYLRECLDSVLAQTFTDWEAICVDDGSTDESGAILDEYAAKDKRFRVIHQANGGHSAARNSGLDVAIGDYIGFIDSDDYVLPEVFERMFETACREDADVIQCGYLIACSDGTNLIKPVNRSLACKDLVSSPDLLHRQTKFVWDKIYRREMLECGKVRFNEDINFHEDFLFLAEVDIVMRGYAVADYVGYVYHVRREGSSTSTYDNRLLDCTKALKMISDLLKSNGLWSFTNLWLLENAFESFMLRIRDMSFYSDPKLQLRLVCDWWCFFNSNWCDWRIRLLSKIGSRVQRCHFFVMTLKPIALFWAIMPLWIKSFVVYCFSKVLNFLRTK